MSILVYRFYGLVSVKRSFPRPLPDPEKQGGDDFVAAELFKDFLLFDNWIFKESGSWLASDQTFSKYHILLLPGAAGIC